MKTKFSGNYDMINKCDWFLEIFIFIYDDDKEVWD